MQGFNMGRYMPPDLEGTKTTPNALHRKRPPGLPDRRGHQTVRFEMPFAVWCAHCPKPTLIAQGVRFNADKSRDGAYHSTPIWRFRLRHAPCGGLIVMRTDPKNTAYEVLEGGKKRDTGEDVSVTQAGAGPILTDQERETLRQNAFAKMEKTISDREQLKHATQRIDGLLDASARHWDDPYAQNQKLRRTFRAGRKQREQDAAVTEELRGRMGLGIDLLPASEEDALRAGLVDFTPEGDGDEAKALTRPLFGRSGEEMKAGKKTTGKPKAEREAEARKGGFVAALMGNTRAVQDPFLNAAGGRGAEGRTPARLPGVKRKREDREESEQPAKAPAQDAPLSGLVNYDSD